MFTTATGILFINISENYILVKDTTNKRITNSISETILPNPTYAFSLSIILN